MNTHAYVSTRILIISNAPESAILFQTELTKYDPAYEIAKSCDLAGVFEIFQDSTRQPDLILLDLGDSSIGNFKKLLNIQNDPQFSHIPIIVVAATGISSQELQDGLALGVNDFVTSPVDWRELSARIRAKVRVKQAEDALRSHDLEQSDFSGLAIEQDEQSDAEIAASMLESSLKALGASNGHLLMYHNNGSVSHYLSQCFDYSPWNKRKLLSRLQASGIIQTILATRTGQIIADTSVQESWAKIPNDPTQSVIAVPITGRREILGVLILTQEKKSFFKENHIPLLQAIANQAGLALENAFLYSIERKRVQELVALHQLIHRINQYANSQSLLEKLAHLVSQYLNYPAVSVWSVDEQKNLSLIKMVGAENAPRYTVIEIAPREAAVTGRSAAFSGGIDERTGARFGIGQPPLLSSIAVPLFWHNRLSGVLAIHSKHTGSFQEGDRILLEIIAAQAGIVLERIELFDAVEEERIRDNVQFMEINQLQNEFIATASHDLKNPIFAVLGYSDLLERVGPLNETQREFLAHIRSAARLMQDLVLNLLDIARIEIGLDLQRDQVNITDLVDRIVDDARTPATAKGVELTQSFTETEPIFVLGDASRLQQAFRNIVDNALRFTPTGGQVDIRTGVVEDKVEISITDNGLGIPADALPKIFEKFFRVRSEETKDIEGNGLGLAIVKSIIEQHGGVVTAESTEGQGSCFTVQLKKTSLVKQEPVKKP